MRLPGFRLLEGSVVGSATGAGQGAGTGVAGTALEADLIGLAWEGLGPRSGVLGAYFSNQLGLNR